MSTRPNLRSQTVLFVANVDWFFVSHRIALASAAVEQGATVHVAASDTGASAPIEAVGATFEPLRLSRSGLHVTEELRSIWELARLYRRIRPTVLHHITAKPVVYGAIARLIAARRSAGISAISGFGYTFGSSPKQRTLRQLITVAYRLVLRRRNSWTIFQNEEDLSDFTRRRIVSSEHAVLIRGSGVDCKLFRPANDRPSLDPPIVLMASRLVQEKGVRSFIALGRRLRATRSAARVVLVGEPDPGNPQSISSSELESAASDGAIEWWGRRTDMPEVLRQASIFVLPTYYREGVPKALIEAAASGLPIVTTDLPGCRDVVLDGTTGFLCEPRDDNALYDRVVQLLESPALRASMGNAGRARACMHFDLESVVEQTLDLYRRALDSNARATS